MSPRTFPSSTCLGHLPLHHHRYRDQHFLDFFALTFVFLSHCWLDTFSTVSYVSSFYDMAVEALMLQFCGDQPLYELLALPVN